MRPRADILRVMASRAVVVLLTLSCLALPAPVRAEEAAKPSPPTPPPPAAISVAEIAARAAQVSNLLRSLTPPPSPELEMIEAGLPGIRSKIELDKAASDSILRGQPTMDMLQTQQVIWQRWRAHTGLWLSLLTQRATFLENALNRLAEVQTTWRETRHAARKQNAPGMLLEQIDTSLAAVTSTEAALQAQRASILALQSVVAKEVDRSEATLAEFTQAQERAVEGILAREAAPVWSAASWSQARAGGRARIHESAASRWAEIVRYVRDPSENMPLHVLVFALLVVAMYAARRRVRRWEASPEGMSPAISVLAHPFEGAVAIALLIAAAPNSLLPPTVRNAVVILGFGVVVRLMRLTANHQLVPEAYMLWALFAADTFRASVASAPLMEQTLLVLEVVAAMGVLAYSLTFGGLRVSSPMGETGRLYTYRAGARLIMLFLGIALVAGAIGYMRLARLLASAVLGSGSLALMLYASVQVVAGLVGFALRVWPLRTLQMVQHHRDLLERRARGLLRLMATLGWAVRVLNYVGLFQLTWSLGKAVVIAKLGRGPIQISLGDILEFLVTVWLAYLASTFIRFVLQEDIYPRTRMKRGITYAVSSLLNYVIIALGFVLALGALGMDLSKVTVLAGAFSVGIGFGLQSVVNNFVSGLILLFERPVHVGDIVEIGDHLSGEVSRIGIRASTVRTYQGAEIIVPNAQLITERVTNWTLSDRQRRIDLRVGVDYGSPPQKVLEVLEAVGRAHPHVLKSPAPSAFFIEFGDSSIIFELRAWTNQFERWGRIQTELAVAVYAGLREAGMSIPFPQRDVHVLRDGSADPLVRETASQTRGDEQGGVIPSASPRP